MKTDSTYSVSFYSDQLNSRKLSLLKDKAILIRDMKNELSEKLCADPKLILNESKFGFMKSFNCSVDGLVGREIQPALKDVFTKYGNKINSAKGKITFHVQKEFVIERYKKNTAKNKKGDIKNYYISKKKTSLTKVLSYLSKWMSPTFIDFILSEVNNPETKRSEEIIEFYKEVLFYVDKYGDRLLSLASLKQENIRRKIFKTPILFKKLTYEGVNNLGEIISENTNKNSILTHCITLSGFGGLTDGGKIFIPVKYNKKYHGDANLFNKKQPSYTIQFVKNKVRLILSKSGKREYATSDSDIFGVDVNLKHNLFSCSSGENIDFDRDKVKNYVKTHLKFCKKHDLMYKSVDSELTPKELKQKYKLIEREEKWQRNLKYEFCQRASELIKLARKNGCNHISVEDLNLSDKSFIRSEEFFGIKYSRLVRILHLGDFKNILTNQCSNRGLQLTIVPSQYTSQRCHKCGYVHRDNRKTQEDFHCQSCGHKDNADYNASQNIKQFAQIEVLSEGLLKKESGWFVPKAQNKYVIRKLLDDFFDKSNINSCNASKDVGVGEGDFITFH